MQARRSAPGAYMPRTRAKQSTPLTPNLQKLQNQQPTADSYIIASLSSSQHRSPSHFHPSAILESNIPGRRVPARTTCANRTSEKDRSSPATVKQGGWVGHQISRNHVSRSHRARRPPQSRVEASVCGRSTNRSHSRSSFSRSAGSSPRLRRTRSQNIIAARGSVLQILAAHGSVRLSIATLGGVHVPGRLFVPGRLVGHR